MRRVLGLAWAVAPLLIGVGCNTARFVERDAAGGVVAVPREANRADAIKLIEKQYGPNYVIDSEGEVVTGQTTVNTTNQDKQSDLNVLKNPFRPQEKVTTQTTSQTHDQKEWRITFHKSPPGGAGAATQVATGRTPPGLPPAPKDSGVMPATYQTRAPGGTPPGLPPAPAGGLQGAVDCTTGN